MASTTNSGSPRADLLLVNARVLTLDSRRPTASAIGVRGDRVLALGCADDVRDLAAAETEILDCEGGLAIPAFHDAHCHLLAYARFRSALDCRHIRHTEDLQVALRRWAESLSPGEWVRANGYDDALLGRHPDRFDLDAAAPDRPLRLQHRSLHLDVLNTRALELSGLIGSEDRRVERDPVNAEPTGRLYSAGDLLQARLPRPTYDALASDVRRASDQLLAWGVTSVQDASFTNGEEEWELFHRLATDGHLRVRTFMLVGSPHWRHACHWRPESKLVRRGPVKLMLDEATSDLAEFRAELHAARKAGNAVAVHAVSEAEVAAAVDALRSPPKGPLPSPNRIEHAAVVPDALLDDLREAGVTVIGQPALVYDRGDVYRAEYAPEQHGWLHRARSFLDAGVPYAAGSDAPVIEPDPAIGLAAARSRMTRGGAVLGQNEALTSLQALRALTLGPAAATGAAAELGRIRPGMIADIAVLDPDTLDRRGAGRESPAARATIMQGHVVWQQGNLQR